MKRGPAEGAPPGGIDAAPGDGPAQLMVDQNGAVLFWARGCERLFGYAAADVVGGPVEIIVPPIHRARHRRGFEAAMSTTLIDRRQSAGVIPVLCADGPIRDHAFRQFQLTDISGRPTGAVVVFSEERRSSEICREPETLED
jgi:PAS domain S-box-containing protein